MGLGIDLFDPVVLGEVEGNDGVGPFGKGLLAVVHLLLVEVLPLQSVGPIHARTPAKRLDEISDRSAVLMPGQAEEVTPDRFQFRLGLG
jgi:hypothetical protein